MAEPERTSRQDLVVPPRHSNFPILLGAVLCAGTGFGLVWALGVGRSTNGMSAVTMPPVAAPMVTMGGADPAPEQPFTAAHPPGQPLETAAGGPSEPKRFPVGEEDGFPRAASDRGWRAPATSSPVPPADERYPTRPATLETPDVMRPLQPPSRGALLQPAAPERFPAPGPDGVKLASAEQAPTEEIFSATLDAPAPKDLLAPPLPAADIGEPSATDLPEPVTQALPPEPPQPAFDASNDLLPPAPAPAPPLRPATPLDASVQPAAPPFASSAQAQLGVSAEPATVPRRFSTSDIDPPATFKPAVAGFSGRLPERTAAASTGPLRPAVATSPFATAPPMGPPQAPRGESPQASGSHALPDSGNDSAGQGRPGPMQLEGLQTPQLALEKRGPREIQVGKSVRYEIFVRNVGNATAQDVTLRDAVPYGTSLIATTPPASPAGPNAGGAPSELVWTLGSLAAGGEARVSMEVMPQIEGEIGSVASVSFRTDASVRSRATKPDLRLESSETKPVRIGGDVQISLKVSNPGTGVATGVVLEGVLPEGVAHRAGRELEFDVGQLQPGESRTIDLTMASSMPGVHMAHFAARADGQIEIEQPVRIEVTAPTLELTAEMPSRRYLQRPATCVLSMINAGTATARSVELAAQLPPGLKFVRANHAGWYEERSHRVLWNLEELPPGETGVVEVTVMPVDLGPQKIIAAARSSDGLSDQTAHTVEVEGLAALCFEVTDSEDPIEVGGMTEYIVRVGNQGTKAASGVRLVATLLGDLEPVEARGPAAHRIDNLTVVFEPLAKLSPSEEAVFRVRVRGRREGDQRMQVQLVSDDHPAPITKEEITRVYADR